MKRFLPTLLAIALLAVLVVPAFAAETTTIPNPLGKAQTIKEVLIRVAQTILGLLGIVGVFMFIWGGYQFILAGGNPELVKKGKATLFWASIGLVIVVGSWVIIQFILTTTTKSTSG